MLQMFGLLFSPQALAEDVSGWGDLAETVAAPKVHEARLYGFIDSYWEMVAPEPDGIDASGNTLRSDISREFDLPNVNVMLQGSLHGKYRYFLNLAAPGAGSATDDEPVQVRNAWVEAPLHGELLAVRAGKLYRRFGLYNEILDAVPTFIGIEPPELFDKDHLMLTRTTNLMLFGSVALSPATRLHYAATTGNDESTGGAVPLGADVHLEADGLKIGTSLYWTGGAAAPSRAVGEGSPRGGVVNWMEEDEYVVLGGYAEATPGGLTLQAEYWRAHHDAVRDPEAVAALADAGLNAQQLERYFTDSDPAQGTTGNAVQYTVQTAYLRAGYAVDVGTRASVTPYAQADWYQNPETVANKDVGGDAEAGLSDNGVFLKYTVGTVLRPVPEVALKIDGSAHQLTYNDALTFYPEVRLSLSYLWQLEK